MLCYRLVPRDASQDDPNGKQDEYVVFQSQFRRWIRETGATLGGHAQGVAAPSIELAKKVAALRKAYGMNQTELADTLGVSRSAIAAMETGRAGNACKLLPKLAAVFQVPRELFLGGMLDQSITIALSADEHDLVALYRRLTTEQKLNVQKYAERRAHA
ncbi:helix-turn-helix transcriptional regulator [Gluconacetobacter sacchari]|uniref:Helix-turn-helix transcriptional regulator n=2 Tax=Gluconacetobacter sacchari TaxID=92759 RepID=A0A7W4IDM3_9PROT|nr:helix-turn-helix transcriptional regulator [Gluconacetobacter sacchari]